MKIVNVCSLAAAATCCVLSRPVFAQPAQPVPPPAPEAPGTAAPPTPPVTDAPAPAGDADVAAPGVAEPAEPTEPPAATDAPVEALPPPQPAPPETAVSQTAASETAAPEVVPTTAEPPAVETPPEEPPPAPSVTPLTITGSFFSRYELRQGYSDLGLTHPRLHRDGDTIVYRARLGLATNPLPIGDGSKVSVTFVPQAAGTHATQGTPETIGDYYNLGVYEAFTRLQNDGFRLDVGRFMMDYGDAMVIGNLDWNETARAFQGARMRLSGDSGYYTDVFATLISEGSGTTGGVFEGDRLFYGIYSGLGPAIGALDLDVYLLGQTFGSIDGVVLDDTTDPPTTGDQEGATFFTLGARVKQAIAAFDYHAEAGLQFGTTPVPGADALDKFAYHADGGVGVTPAPGFRIGVGGLVASGDSDPTDDKSEAWDELFPTAHKFLGLTDAFGSRSNALSGNADLAYKASDALILKLQAHLLARMEDNAAGETFAGTELDTHVVHPMGAGMVLRGMYGVFLPNEDYWGSSDAVHFLEIQYGIDFK